MADANVRPSETGTKGRRPRILTEPLPQILDEIERSIRLADEAATNAREATQEARRAGEEALAKSEEAKKVAEDAARLASEAEEDYRKAIESLPADIAKRVIFSRQFLAAMLLVFVSGVFAAVSLSLGLPLITW